MNCAWLYRQQRERLILFCNGWGMDATPFQPLTATGVDVLILFDYHDLPPEDSPRSNNPAPDLDLAGLFRRYPHISLIAWSMGVWAGQQLFRPWARLLQESIAINGTLCPIDDGFGIPVQVYAATLDQFNEAGRLKFYHRMCHDRNILAAFLAHQPQRTLTSQRRELAALQELTSCQPAESAIYSRVIVTTRDLVMPTANQLAYWQGHDILTLAGSHFPFYRWDSWEGMLNALT